MIGTATVLSKEGKTIVSDDDLGLELAVDRGFFAVSHNSSTDAVHLDPFADSLDRWGSSTCLKD